MDEENEELHGYISSNSLKDLDYVDSDSLELSTSFTLSEEQKNEEMHGNISSHSLEDLNDVENDSSESLTPFTLLEEEENEELHGNISSNSSEDLNDVENDSSESLTPFTLSENDAHKSSGLAHCTKLKNGSYKCDYCTQTCRRRDVMKNHILTHTKEKPHACSFCEKSFSLKFNLKRHVQRIHDQS